jgi:hypothetical protein
MVADMPKKLEANRLRGEAKIIASLPSNEDFCRKEARDAQHEAVRLVILLVMKKLFNQF